jgi:hypothetical protein
MLRVQGRATTGVIGILRSLSAMAEDAINEVADLNPFKGLRVRANDPRAKKKAKADPHLQLRADARLRQSGRAL